MEVWPPSPTSDHPEPNLELTQAKKKKRIGYIALACSVIALMIRLAGSLFGFHSILLGGLSLLTAGIGFVLGIISRSTLAGRFALLVPVSFLLLIIYYILCWYRVLPYHHF
jgi:hypothetical protein